MNLIAIPTPTPTSKPHRKPLFSFQFFNFSFYCFSCFFFNLWQWITGWSNSKSKSEWKWKRFLDFGCETWDYIAFFACTCWTSYWSNRTVDGNCLHWSTRLVVTTTIQLLRIRFCYSHFNWLFFSYLICLFIGTVELASAGVSVSIFNIISKLFNIPLLSVATSFVAEDMANVAKNSDSASG